MAEATNQAINPPGDQQSLPGKALKAAAHAVQNFQAINPCQHVCGFHMAAHDSTRQIRVHHFCSHLNADVRQCILTDSDAKGARIIGIEYMISKALFEGLDDEEKKLWHSHDYEVASGTLVAPGLPHAVANIDMADVQNTYGKTWHTWQVDLGHQLPLGPPQLMMAFTQDGQIDPGVVEARDRDLGCSTDETARSRKDLEPEPGVPHPKADPCWNEGKALQCVMEERDFKRGPETAFKTAQ